MNRAIERFGFLILAAAGTLSAGVPAMAMAPRLQQWFNSPSSTSTPAPISAQNPTSMPTSQPTTASTTAASPVAASPLPAPSPSASPTTVAANALTNPTPNPNCTLVVPDQPLTAEGMATPFQLKATDPANGPCVEANANQTAFVEAAIIDIATGQITLYRPLVVTAGDQPLVKPTVPTVPPDSVVALWFGFNGSILALEGEASNTLQSANCVTGLGDSPFGEVSSCNSREFFARAYKAVHEGKLKVPPLGTARDGMTCPTTRDFSVVDQDQSDNVTTQYITDAQGQMAQDTPANEAAFPNGTILANGSDNLLLTKIDAAIGCQPFSANDLSSGQPGFALVLNEISANFNQQAPIALVPLGDPMALINGEPNPAVGTESQTKMELYRTGVGQPVQVSGDTRNYCENLLQTGLPRLFKDMPFTSQAGSLNPAAANNLFTFLAQRFAATFGPPAEGGAGLGPQGCTQLLGVGNPINLTTDGNGVVTAATLASTAGTGTGATPSPSPTPTLLPSKHKRIPWPVSAQTKQPVDAPELKDMHDGNAAGANGGDGVQPSTNGARNGRGD